MQRLRERGKFEIPESVREATTEFKEHNDVAKLFLEEACVR